MSRQVSLTVYKFSELSETARERAKMDHGALFGYSWSSEALKSLKALAAHFGGRVKDYEVDWWNTSYSSASFEMPEMTAAEIRRRLRALGSYNRKTLKGEGDCKLTGFCLDENAIDGFRWAFMREGERDLSALMEAAFRSWLKACQDDAEDQYSDEQFGETADANGWEYYQDGELA